jgi:glycosyltransferase involved in cell wall biosynthesis
MWHVAEAYPPDYGGGAAVYLRDVCRLLARRGHEIRVLCVENADREPYTLSTDYDGPVRIDRLNLPYIKSQDPEGWGLGLRGWRAHQKRVVQVLGEFLDAWRPDLVHCHLARLFGEEWLIDVHQRGIPVVWMLHDAWPLCLRLNLLRSPCGTACHGPSGLRCLECIYSHYDGSHTRALLKLPWRLVKQGLLPAYRVWRRSVARQHLDGMTGVSQFITDLHAPYIRGPVQFTPLGIDLTGLPADPPSRPRSPLRFGFVGGFQSHKGIWQVLDAAVSLQREELPFELHVWGPWQEKGRAAIVERGLEHQVILHGMYLPEQRWEVFSSIDVALMATTVCETLGRVVLEAAATGAPTIAPAVGGLPEMIHHDVNGLLFEFQNAGDLKHQMRRILMEPELLPHLIDNLQPVLDTRRAVDAVEEFYYNLLHHQEGRASLAA